MPRQQPVRFELPPPWQPGGPGESEGVEWDDEADIPAAWLPDIEPPSPEPQGGESARELLERLSRAAEAAALGRTAAAPAGDAETNLAADMDSDVPPPPQLSHDDSMRLRQLRERLSSTASLREALLLKEILGPPRARRRN